MKKVLIVFSILSTVCLSQNTQEIEPKMGHRVDFSKESFEIFNDILIISGEKKGNLSKNRSNDFYEKYLYEEPYSDFYDMTKQELWEVTGNGDGEACYSPCPYKILTSSFLNFDNKYKSQNLYDNSFKTAWVEGVNGYGIGEYFEYYINNYKYFKKNEFNEEVDSLIPTINEIHLFNGYVKSEKAFKENSRIKKLKMYVDGKPWAILKLADTTSQQIFKIPEINYLKIKNRKDYKEDFVIKFEIMEVYPGTKYKDTVLTELLMYTYQNLCFPKGSKVTMENNSYINIEDLKIGDKILSYNEEKNEFFSDEIIELGSAEHENYIEYDFSDKKIITTDDHPLLTTNGWKSKNIKGTRQYKGYENVTEIKIGDKIIFNKEQKNIYKEIKNIKKLESKKLGYTITKLKMGNNFIVNDAIAGVEELE